jgi:hypothetical protein
MYGINANDKDVTLAVPILEINEFEQEETNVNSIELRDAMQLRHPRASKPDPHMHLNDETTSNKATTKSANLTCRIYGTVVLATHKKISL